MAPFDPFQAVADPTRRGILGLLRQREHTAGEIAAEFDISWPAVSQHLRRLKESGLVRERRRGRKRIYTLDAARLATTLGSWLAEFDARWEQDVESLKSHVEAKTKRTREDT